MNKTSNYQLCQWDGDDRILRTDFNEDNAKIDAALKQQANSIASINAALPGKASASTVTSLSAQLNAEIQNRKNADDAEATAREAADTAEATARAQADAALTAALALKGNCQLETFSYTGAGTFGSADPTILNFSQKPLLFVILGNQSLGVGGKTSTMTSSLSYSNFGNTTSILSLETTWSGSQAKLVGGNSNVQLNNSGQTYQVIALLAADE